MIVKTSNFTKIAAAAILAVAMTFSSAAMAKPGKPGDANIVQIAMAVNAESGEFTTLLTAATCPSLGGAVVALLTGEDKLTLFAPTDAAFADIGLNAANVCSVPAGVLLPILAYHVTDGRRFSNSLFNANAWKTVDMLAGGSISTYVAEGPVATIVDNAGGEAAVVMANINASNGVIHVISAVLSPFAP